MRYGYQRSQPLCVEPTRESTRDTVSTGHVAIRSPPRRAPAPLGAPAKCSPLLMLPSATTLTLANPSLCSGPNPHRRASRTPTGDGTRHLIRAGRAAQRSRAAFRPQRQSQTHTQSHTPSHAHTKLSLSTSSRKRTLLRPRGTQTHTWTNDGEQLLREDPRKQKSLSSCACSPTPTRGWALLLRPTRRAALAPAGLPPPRHHSSRSGRAQ
jgi:hypothetical protein